MSIKDKYKGSRIKVKRSRIKVKGARIKDIGAMFDALVKSRISPPLVGGDKGEGDVSN